MKCSCYKPVKPLMHGMKVIEMVFEKIFRRIVTVNEIQFGFICTRGFVVDVT